MGFLHASRNLYDLKLPIVPKERTSVLSYQLAQMWSQGEEGVWSLQLSAVKYLFFFFFTIHTWYSWHKHKWLLRERHNFYSQVYPLTLLLFFSPEFLSLLDKLYFFNCLLSILERNLKSGRIELNFKKIIWFQQTDKKGYLNQRNDAT